MSVMLLTTFSRVLCRCYYVLRDVIQFRCSNDEKCGELQQWSERKNVWTWITVLMFCRFSRWFFFCYEALLSSSTWIYQVNSGPSHFLIDFFCLTVVWPGYLLLLWLVIPTRYYITNPDCHGTHLIVYNIWYNICVSVCMYRCTFFSFFILYINHYINKYINLTRVCFKHS